MSLSGGLGRFLGLPTPYNPLREVWAEFARPDLPPEVRNVNLNLIPRPPNRARHEEDIPLDI